MIKGIIVDKFNSGSTAVILRVSNTDGSRMPSFRPGQYTALGLEDSGVENVRAYSICSDPIEPFWEFLITVVQGGKVSGALANLSPGDFVFYKPTPKGTMTLERLNNHTTVVFVATGSGVGPFKPMILEILRSEQAKDMNLVLVQGARTISELHYRNLFEDLMTKHHKFKYLPYVSRENVGNSSLSAGRVTDFIKNSEFDPKSTLFYLCGNPTMIQDVKTILTEKGHITGKGGNVVTESYW